MVHKKILIALVAVVAIVLIVAVLLMKREKKTVATKTQAQPQKIASPPPAVMRKPAVNVQPTPGSNVPLHHVIPDISPASTTTTAVTPAGSAAVAPQAGGNLQLFWINASTGTPGSGWLGYTTNTTGGYTLAVHLNQANGAVWQLDPNSKALYTMINGKKYGIDNSRWDAPPPNLVAYDPSNAAAVCILGRQQDSKTGQIYNSIMYSTTMGCLMTSGGAYPQAFIYNCSGNAVAEKVQLNGQAVL